MITKFILSVAIVTELTGAVILASSEPTTSTYDAIPRMGICVIGSMLGALIAITVVPPSNDSEVNIIRRLSFKFFASQSGGILFAPAAIEYLHLSTSPEMLMAISGAMAISLVGTIHTAVPYWESAVRKFLKSKGLGDPPASGQ